MTVLGFDFTCTRVHFRSYLALSLCSSFSHLRLPPSLSLCFVYLFYQLSMIFSIFNEFSLFSLLVEWCTHAACLACCLSPTFSLSVSVSITDLIRSLALSASVSPPFSATYSASVSLPVQSLLAFNQSEAVHNNQALTSSSTSWLSSSSSCWSLSCALSLSFSLWIVIAIQSSNINFNARKAAAAATATAEAIRECKLWRLRWGCLLPPHSFFLCLLNCLPVSTPSAFPLNPLPTAYPVASQGSEYVESHNAQWGTGKGSRNQSLLGP